MVLNHIREQRYLILKEHRGQGFQGAIQGDGPEVAVMSASKLSSPAQSQNKHLLGWPKKELIHSPNPSSRTRSVFKEESLEELNKMFSRVGHFAL